MKYTEKPLLIPRMGLLAYIECMALKSPYQLGHYFLACRCRLMLPYGQVENEALLKILRDESAVLIESLIQLLKKRKMIGLLLTIFQEVGQEDYIRIYRLSIQKEDVIKLKNIPSGLKGIPKHEYSNDPEMLSVIERNSDG